MEDSPSQKHLSTSGPSKPIEPHVKACLERWYENLGKPKSIPQFQKDTILRRIQSDIEPAGISLKQLNHWLMLRRRRSDKDATVSPTIPRRRHPGTDILFPKLASHEIDHLKILLGENPDPSSALIAMWVDSPSLPNLTIEDAHRFINYDREQLRSNRERMTTSPSARKLPHEDIIPMKNANRYDEDDMQDGLNQTHLPTPDSTSPEPSSKPDPGLTPTIPSGSSPSPPAPLPHDPRALIEMLRSQLSPAELQKLLKEAASHVTSASLAPGSSSALNTDRLPTPPQSHLRSPISPSQDEAPASFQLTPLVSHGQTQDPNDPNKALSHVNFSNSSQAPPSSPSSTPTPLGLFPKKVIGELSQLFSNVNFKPKLTEPEHRLGLCQQMSERFMMALERGNLREFGLLPSEELKDLGLGGQAWPPIPETNSDPPDPP